jgi:hypothetical protein
MPSQRGSNPPRRPRSLFERNYRRLEDIIGRPLPDLQSGIVYRLRAEGFMDLVVELLPPCPETGATVLSLAHYFLQNGDLCQDPEMVVRAFPPRGEHPGHLEALVFQQALPPVYSVVYPEPGKVVPRLKRELNAFLGTWLRNLKVQGHRLVPERE